MEFFDEMITRQIKNTVILLALFALAYIIPFEIIIISMLWAIYIKI